MPLILNMIEVCQIFLLPVPFYFFPYRIRFDKRGFSKKLEHETEHPNLLIDLSVRGTGSTCKINFDILGIFYNFAMQAEGNFRGNYITGMPLRKFPHGY